MATAMTKSQIADHLAKKADKDTRKEGREVPRRKGSQ
jgi:hypothetical protein